VLKAFLVFNTIDSEAGTDFMRDSITTHAVKKLSSFILLILYFSSAVGTAVHQHYCMGELVGMSIFNTKNKACGKCGMEKHTEASKDCCKDVSIVIKSGDSHTFFQPVYDCNSFCPALPEINFTICDVRVNPHNNTTTYRAHSPPLLKHPLFLRFSCFRI